MKVEQRKALTPEALSAWRKKNREDQRKFVAKHPYYHRAKTAAQKAVRCPKGSERHHWSYNEEHWTDVMIFTRENHRFIHKYIKRDNKTGFYYSTEDMFLLDTKEKHSSYINMILKANGRL